MSEITADHVRELADLAGKNVLVKQADRFGGDLWVIGCGNRHYGGADTALATSNQVEDLLRPEDWDGLDLKQEAAERVARKLMELGQGAAYRSAADMPNAGGHPEAPSGIPGDEPLTGVEYRAKKRQGSGVPRGLGYDQGDARRRARDLGGIAVAAWPHRSDPTRWNVGGWASSDERWIVISLDGQIVLDDNPAPPGEEG
jgi:hypothetical protein